MFRKLLDAGSAGDNVGVLLRGVSKEAVERGMVIGKPGAYTPHTTFKAAVSLITALGLLTQFRNGERLRPFIHKFYISKEYIDLDIFK